MDAPPPLRGWRRLVFWAIELGCLFGLSYALAGCTAPETNTVKGVGMTAGGGAVGALFSPVGAAIGAAAAYL